MGLTLVPPPTPPQPLEELLLPDARALLRLDGTAEDALVALFLGAACAYVEGRDGIGNRALLTQTWDWTLDRFPRAGRALHVPLPPLQAVTSITVVAPDGTPTPWPATEYQVDLADAFGPGRILPVPTASWPLPAEQLAPITVRFVAGYGDRLADVPRPLRLALLGLTSTFYTNRDAAAPAPAWVETLLAPYRLAAA